jgi:hypothetical protein
MTFPCLVQSRRQKPVPYAEYGGWHRAVKMESPNVTTTLKNLSALYRRQGKLEAAEAVESCAMRSKKRALDVVKQTKVAELLGIEATDMASGQKEQSLVEDDSKKPKRRSSFSKLKKHLSIRFSRSRSSSMEDLSSSRSSMSPPLQPESPRSPSISCLKDRGKSPKLSHRKGSFSSIRGPVKGDHSVTVQDESRIK